MDLLASLGDLGPVGVGCQGLDLPVAFQVAEGDAAPGALQQGLVAIIACQEQRGCQLGLVEHHYVGPLLTDEPVKVLLLLRGVEASDIPHEDLQWDPADVEVLTDWSVAPVIDAMGQLSLGRAPLLMSKSGVAGPLR